MNVLRPLLPKFGQLKKPVGVRYGTSDELVGTHGLFKSKLQQASS